MANYGEERLFREVSAMHLELRAANEHAWTSGQISERSFAAISSDLDRMDGDLLGISDLVQQVVRSLDSQLPLIVSYLARSGELLEHIMNSVQNPVTTQAVELRRLGLVAFKNGWLSEAIVEFRKSIEVYGYDSSVHFALGCALAGEQNYAEAADAFAMAARYGVPDPLPLAASAAIMSARLYDQLGSGERAVDVLAACHEAIPAAADVAYELARRTGRRQHLCDALSLKPWLLAQARVDNLPEVEQAACEVLDVAPGFAGLQADAARAFGNLATLLEQDGQPIPAPVVPLPAFPSASARLALFTSELPLTRQRLSDAMSKVSAYASELSDAARKLVQNASYAEARTIKPIPPPEPRVTKGAGVKPVISGIAAFVMLILVIVFQSSDLAGTASGKSLLIGLAVWGAFLVSGAVFVGTVRPALQEARENGAARSRHKASMDDHRKSLAAYQSESGKAAELRSIADAASRKADTFNSAANSVTSAAAEVRRRFDWTIVEPIAMSVGAGIRSISHD